MSAARAERRRAVRAAQPTPDYPVVRTRPLEHTDDRGRSLLIGHGSDNPRLVLTAHGNVSHPGRLQGRLEAFRPSKSHRRRIEALRRRGLVSRVTRLIRGGDAA